VATAAATAAARRLVPIVLATCSSRAVRSIDHAVQQLLPCLARKHCMTTPSPPVCCAPVASMPAAARVDSMRLRVGCCCMSLLQAARILQWALLLRSL
jgi:hypothetical protein